MAIATMDPPHLTKTGRKLSVRQHLKQAIKGFKPSRHAHAPGQGELPRSPLPGPRVGDISPGYDFLGNGLPQQRDVPRDRPRRRPHKQKSFDIDHPRNSLFALKFENPSLDDLRMSFDTGRDDDHLIVQRSIEQARRGSAAVGRGAAEKEVVDTYNHLPGHTIANVGSESEASTAPSRVDSTRPEHDAVPELRKSAKKFEVRLDTGLARPVSRATANTDAEKVSKTIESINNQNYSAPAMRELGQSGAPLLKSATKKPAYPQTIDATEWKAELPSPYPPARQQNMMASQTIGLSNATIPKQQELPPFSSIQPSPTKTNTPIANSMVESSTFSFGISDNLRRVGTTEIGSSTSDRHSIGDMNRLLEQNRGRESTVAPKEKSYPPALDVKRSFSVGAKSPTQIDSAPNTSGYRPRRPSGKMAADRLKWIKDLEEGKSKGANAGRSSKAENIQGGVAAKLARFEASNKALSGGSGPGLTRTNSVSSDAYGIENRVGSRLSRASTLNEEFRRKMEEVAEKAKKRVENEGDQEALIAQVNRDAELALKEEKRRSLQLNSKTFDYTHNDKAGQKADLIPDLKRAAALKGEGPAFDADLESFTPTKEGNTRIQSFMVSNLSPVAGSPVTPIKPYTSSTAERIAPPQFKLKDANMVAGSANPQQALDEAVPAPVTKVKDPSAVAASANPSVSEAQEFDEESDDGEYDPFKPTKYPVTRSALKPKGQSLRSKSEQPKLEPTIHLPVTEPVPIAMSDPVEEVKAEVSNGTASAPAADDQESTLQAEEKTLATSESEEPASASTGDDQQSVAHDEDTMRLASETETEEEVASSSPTNVSEQQKMSPLIGAIDQNADFEIASSSAPISAEKVTALSKEDEAEPAPSMEDEKTFESPSSPPPQVEQTKRELPTNSIKNIASSEDAPSSIADETKPNFSSPSSEMDQAKAALWADQASYKARLEQLSAPVTVLSKPEIEESKAVSPFLPTAEADEPNAPTSQSSEPQAQQTKAEPSLEFTQTNAGLKDAASSASTGATVPTIETTPPTPPTQKETPFNPSAKIAALRERAAKAAAVSSKTAPLPKAKEVPDKPIAVPTSQTFSRLFGPPPLAGRSRSPSPMKKVDPCNVGAAKADTERVESPQVEPTSKLEIMLEPKESPLEKETVDENETTTHGQTSDQDDTPVEKTDAVQHLAAAQDAPFQKDIPNTEDPMMPQESPIAPEAPVDPTSVQGEPPVQEEAARAKDSKSEALASDEQKPHVPTETQIFTEPSQAASVRKEVSTAPAKTSPLASASDRMSPMAALAMAEAALAMDDGPVTPRMGASGVDTSTGHGSPKTPEPSAATLPNLDGCKD